MSCYEDESSQQDDRGCPFVSAIRMLQQAGIRPPMAADEPFDPPIAKIRQRVPAARTVLARCNGEVFLIFTEIGDRDGLSSAEALAAIRSENRVGTLTVVCDLPADVNHLGRLVAEIRGYSIVFAARQFVRRDHDKGGRS